MPSIKDITATLTDKKFDDLLTCRICCAVFTHPLMLTCQHTFCLGCIVHSCSEDYQDAIACPTCRQPTKFPGGVVSKLPKNMTIMDMLDKCGKKNNLLTQKRIHQLLTDNKQRRHPTEIEESSESDDSDEDSSDESSSSSSDGSTVLESRETASSSDDEDASSSDDSDNDDDSSSETVSEEYTLDSYSE